MKKKKKQCYPCIPQHETCMPFKTLEMDCKPTDICKKTSKKYVNYGCDDCDMTFEDKCVKLAKIAEELFQKALEHEKEAIEANEQAKQCEKKAKTLAAKADKLLKNAKYNEDESKLADCTAKELMEKAQKLSEQAKCLYKEADKIESEAQCSCEKAKCLYEKCYEHNANAKELYNQAMKCDEKALVCYKSVGEKIKEYEMKSKKCEEMIEKCSGKIFECNGKIPQEESKMNSEYIYCDMYLDYECENYNSIQSKNKSYNKNEIVYVEESNLCPTYVSPMYDMAPMQYMGGMYNQYPSLDMPYINPGMCEYQEMNDMWMNYYMMMQNMMMQNMMPRK